MCTHACRYQVSDPLELELQMVVSHPTEVLRIEFRTSGRVEVISTTETALTPWKKKKTIKKQLTELGGKFL